MHTASRPIELSLEGLNLFHRFFTEAPPAPQPEEITIFESQLDNFEDRFDEDLDLLPYDIRVVAMLAFLHVDERRTMPDPKTVARLLHVPDRLVEATYSVLQFQQYIDEVIEGSNIWIVSRDGNIDADAVERPLVELRSDAASWLYRVAASNNICLDCKLLGFVSLVMHDDDDHVLADIEAIAAHLKCDVIELSDCFMDLDAEGFIDFDIERLAGRMLLQPSA